MCVCVYYTCIYNTNMQARTMVVVGRRQNFFRRPFSAQICEKCVIYILKKVEDQKKVLTYFCRPL